MATTSYPPQSYKSIGEAPSTHMLATCCCVAELLRRAFVDLRLISLIMCVWLAIVIVIMTEIGIFANPAFVGFGPRPTLMFMHVQVDTSYKYSMLVVMIILHTIVTDFISDSLSPHILNHVQDLRNRYLPHRHIVYYAITSLWAVYCAVSQLFLIFLALGQLDLLVVRLLSDIVANTITTSLYLENKVFDPVRFHEHEVRAAHEDDEIVVFQRSERELMLKETNAPPAAGA